jgi:hypothetical protein
MRIARRRRPDWLRISFMVAVGIAWYAVYIAVIHSLPANAPL